MGSAKACRQCGAGELAAVHIWADVKDFHQFIYHLDDLISKTDIEKAIDIISELRAQLMWCSASADFQKTGKARVGWEKGPMKSMEKATEFITKMEAR